MLQMFVLCCRCLFYVPYVYFLLKICISIADETDIFLYLPQIFVFYYLDFIADDCSMLQMIVICCR